MKDIKITLKAVLANWLPWGKALLRPYLLLAAVAAVFVYALMRVCASTLMPIWILRSETSDWDLILAIVGLDLAWAIVFGVSLVAVVACSVLAHKQMRVFVAAFARKEMGRSHRNVLTAIVLLLLVGSVLVAFMPTTALFVSYNVAALSGMMLDAVAAPGWLHPAVLVFTMVGVLFCEIIATFARLCYRDILLSTKEPENELETSDAADALLASGASC